MGVPTKLSAYQIPETSINTLVDNLVKHGYTSLGEHKDITLKWPALFYKAHFNFASPARMLGIIQLIEPLIRVFLVFRMGTYPLDLIIIFSTG